MQVQERENRKIKKTHTNTHNRTQNPVPFNDRRGNKIRCVLPDFFFYLASPIRIKCKTCSSFVYGRKCRLSSLFGGQLNWKDPEKNANETVKLALEKCHFRHRRLGKAGTELTTLRPCFANASPIELRNTLKIDKKQYRQGSGAIETIEMTFLLLLLFLSKDLRNTEPMKAVQRML